MATYLLTWNPDRWAWKDLADAVDRVRAFGRESTSWSCGNTKRITERDRVFLLKQGVEPRGLVGSGWATSETYEDEHWEDPARKGFFVRVDFDALAESPIIGRSELNLAPFDRVNWDSPASGISIEQNVARSLEAEWGRRVGSHFEPLPDEIDAAEFEEGGVTRITVNAYERDAQARRACIAHYGCKCFICGFEFLVEYGEAAEGLIHVHHRIELAQRGVRHRVNAIQDLVPVCPNCHAVIHRRSPCYEVDEVIAMRREALKVRG